MYMGSGECNEGVDNTVCHPKEKKACVSSEGVCPLALKSSADKVTDAKIDKKLVSKVRVIPCQIDQKFRVTTRILMKLGIFVVPMGLITHTNF